MLKDSDDNPQAPAMLRDHLAGDRTALANERTLLAYIRTSLTFFIAGVSFIKIFDDVLLIAIGWVFIPMAAIALILGIRSFKGNNKHIHRVVCDSDLGHDRK